MQKSLLSCVIAVVVAWGTSVVTANASTVVAPLAPSLNAVQTAGSSTTGTLIAVRTCQCGRPHGHPGRCVHSRGHHHHHNHHHHHHHHRHPHHGYRGW